MAATKLSTRGQYARDSQEGEKLVWEVCANLWDPIANPDGYVSLGMAENALMHNELREFLSGKLLIDAEAKAFTYGDGPSGSKNIKCLLSTFFNEYFCPFIPVEPDHLMITNGVTSAIEHAAWAIANPGEGILVGRPYYRAFIMDMELRPGVKMVPVSFGDIDPCGLDCVTRYEEAILDSNRRGVRIRAVLLCHPHNPLGRCYAKDTIVELMKLCEKYTIHLISDEIYALSTWHNAVDVLNADSGSFTSVLSIQTQGIISSDLVHVLWGSSKDFGANGIRMGVTISQANRDFLTACRSCAIFSSPSSLAENAIAHILSDRSFLNNYITTNKQRLSKAYEYAVQRLNDYGIEYLHGSSAAFFLWVNLGKAGLRSMTAGQDLTETDTIYKALLQGKVFLVSGDATGAEQKGWFRLVFSQRRQLVDEAIRRIAKILGRYDRRSISFVE